MRIQRTDVQTLIAQLNAFAVADAYMSLPQVVTFVRVLELLADSDDRWVHQRDISAGVPVTQPSVSRSLTYWSKFGDRDHGFLELSQDPQDRRQGIVSLTPKGSAFARSVFPQLAGG